MCKTRGMVAGRKLKLHMSKQRMVHKKSHLGVRIADKKPQLGMIKQRLAERKSHLDMIKQRLAEKKSDVDMIKQRLAEKKSHLHMSKQRLLDMIKQRLAENVDMSKQRLAEKKSDVDMVKPRWCDKPSKKYHHGNEWRPHPAARRPDKMRLLVTKQKEVADGCLPDWWKDIDEIRKVSVQLCGRDEPGVLRSAYWNVDGVKRLVIFKDKKKPVS